VATRVVETANARETEALGADLATRLSAGDVVLVVGELGSGKTTLVRGAARALGVCDPVTSPTFSIGHRYRGASVTVSHLDLYRLEGLEHEDPELLEDYLGPGRIAFVEWPEAAGSEMRDVCMRVRLVHAGADRRRIEVVESAPVASGELHSGAPAG
jgi:tRNA threonylcarbamoyladenosine biosynthesis protein TsaE